MWTDINWRSLFSIHYKATFKKVTSDITDCKKISIETSQDCLYCQILLSISPKLNVWDIIFYILNFTHFMFSKKCTYIHPFLIAQLVKKIYLQCRRSQFDSWVGKIPWRRDRLPIPIFLGFPNGSDGKESACMWETWVQSLG